MRRVGRYVAKLTPGQVARLRDLYREGWSTPRLAELFGVSWQAVHYHLKRAGVELRPRNRKPSDRPGSSPGVTVTLREQKSGRIFTGARAGRPDDALRDFALAIDNLAREDGVDWRVVCLSTPQTIASDLRGAKRLERPEVAALRRIGRLDLLDPEVP